MIGYHLAHDQSLLGMAMTQGPQKKVINIGLGILMLKIPNRISLASYIESQQHKARYSHAPLKLPADI
jgi:4'-phosphopantetheinyl transferase